MHHFHNFRIQDNGRTPTLIEALRESINLPFIRLMRDLVRYSTYQGPNNSAELLKDDTDPRRQEYLAQFDDREGTTFLLKFWKKYRNKNTQARLDTFLDSMHPTAIRLAAVHRYLLPNASQASFNSFIRSHLSSVKSTEKLTDERLDTLDRNYGPGAYDLPDQGYIAKVHPLDLWLMGYLLNNPDATFTQATAASEHERQEVYSWLFKSRHKSARDSRIRTMLDIEASPDIHQRWQKGGYPFDHLVPSLATAIGSSGDRPAALAELMGIILNDGVRPRVLRIDSLHFAADTPYETRLINDPKHGKQVIPVRRGQGPARRTVPSGGRRHRQTRGRQFQTGRRHAAGHGRQDRHRRQPHRGDWGGRTNSQLQIHQPHCDLCVLPGRTPLRHIDGLCARPIGGAFHLYLGVARAGAQGHGADPDALPATGRPDAVSAQWFSRH